MLEKEKTKEEQEFEDDVKAYAEESGKTEEEITAAYCHCCGQRLQRGMLDNLFGTGQICQCGLSKHCYRCGRCHTHCQCEEGPTPTVKFWLIEKHGKIEPRKAVLELHKGGLESFQSLVDYAMAYMDLVRSEQYTEDKAAKFNIAAFKALLTFVYGEDIFKEINRLLDAQTGR